MSTNKRPFEVLPADIVPQSGARPEAIHEFTTSVLTLARAVNSRRQADGMRLGLSDIEMKAMGRISEGDGLSAGRLGELLSLTTGSVTALVDRLVTAEMVERARNPDDRRAIVLTLTERGAAAMRSVYTAFQLSLVEATAHLDEVALERFTSMMRELAPKIRPSV